MQVQDVMSRGAVACHLADTAHRAAELMWSIDCGCLPVVDCDGRAFSMVTDRDLTMAAYLTGRALHDIPVCVAQSHQLWFVRETDSLHAAEALMRKHQVRRLPVLDAADRPIGILAMNDLLRHADAGNHGGDELAPETIVHTLAGIGRSRHAEHALAAE
jgi:CBS-domain-containing membrane protein